MNHKIILLIVIVSSLGISAQERLSRYPFIKQEINRLYFANDSSDFLNFYKKLDELRDGKNQRVSIVHIGGSHVQGGTWSNEFLTDFQQDFKTAGGGYFSFPYKIAKTNSQPFATSFTNGKWKRCRALGKDPCLPLGMSALSVITNDSANYFGVAFTDRAACKYVNIVKVYYNFNPSFELTAHAKDNATIGRKDNEKAGYTQFNFDMPVDSVSFELLRKDTLQKDFILYGFSLEDDLAPGFYLAGLGANGASSGSFLRCQNLSQQLETLHPDLVILSLGVNDTQSKAFEKEDYIEHYDSLIMAIKRANPHVAILLTTTTDNYIKRKTANKRTEKAHDAMFELMEKHHVAVWDLFSLMGGYKSMPKWQKAGLAVKDKVHFTAKGYVLLGDMMYEAVNRSYLNNRIKNRQ